MRITEDEFLRYEEVRVGGKTNMFHLSNVFILSGLSRETILVIQNNYGELSRMYLHPKENDLRIWCARENPIEIIHHYFVKDIRSALKKVDELAEEDLKNLKTIDNICSLEIFKNNSWEVWEDEKGNHFDDISRMNADEQIDYIEKSKGLK